jgi:hypothetical protein
MSVGGVDANLKGGDGAYRTAANIIENSSGKQQPSLASA